MIKKGTVIRAKSFHPERVRGGPGVAVILQDETNDNCVLAEWITSACNPYAPRDIVNIKSLLEAFDIIDKSEHHKYVPKGWKPAENELYPDYIYRLKDIDWGF